ncbi:unnamed protein product [Durusdinium trenchii]|uniref:PDZ domain-containing protein n=1 Tax=Durusdinium trenchii TaxID=1381693 RepID=A0ABP0QVJ1_9DINO
MLVVWETHKHTLSLVIITLETKSEKVTVPISRAQHRTTRCCSVWSSSFLGGLGEPEKGGELQEGEEYIDPKDAAFQRQQEIIAARKRKLQPNYKETAREKKVRLRKLAMWNAVQRKGMTDVVGRSEATVDIKVNLMKPLGIEFEKFDTEPNRAWVSAILEEGSAYRNDEVERGDYLFSVNGKEVDGMPYEEAIQVLIDAEGSMELVFKRIYTVG